MLAPLRKRLFKSKMNVGFLGIRNPFSVSTHNPHFNHKESLLGGGSRKCLYSNYGASIPVRVSCILPFLAILSNTFGTCRLLSTHIPVDEEEVTEEKLHQLLLAIENDPISCIDVCSIYIEKLCRSGNLLAAARLMQSLRDRHIFLSPTVYNTLLLVAGERNDIGLLFQVFKDLLVSCKSLSSSSYHNLAKAFMKTGDDISLLKFAREISELTSPRPTVINRIIYAVAKCGQVDKALLIFDHMTKGLKCKPDLITYNTVLGILGCSGQIEEMVHEFASMKEANIAPDIVSYNTLINSLKKMGRLDLCLIYLKEMAESGLVPDLRTYTALIDSFGSSGNIEESLRLFGDMKHRQIRPSIYVYKSLIDSLKKMGKLELALKFSEEMNSCLEDLVGPKDFKREKG